MKKLQIFTTGGTVDKIYFDALSEFQIGDPVVGPILESMNVGFEFYVDELMRLDSLDMTDQHRQTIQQRVSECDAEYILIMHGTDGMVETAGWLGVSAIKKLFLPVQCSRQLFLTPMQCLILAVQWVRCRWLKMAFILL